jgi:hypothetical protein
MANQPYPEKTTSMDGGSITVDILFAILYGGKCLGYRKISFNDAAVKAFADAVVGGVPAGSRYAVCVLEADATEANLPRVARMREDGIAPTAAEGLPIGDNGSFEIKGSDNIANFKIIGVTAAKNHILRIHFYGEG